MTDFSSLGSVQYFRKQQQSAARMANDWEKFGLPTNPPSFFSFRFLIQNQDSGFWPIKNFLSQGSRRFAIVFFSTPCKILEAGPPHRWIFLQERPWPQALSRAPAPPRPRAPTEVQRIKTFSIPIVLEIDNCASTLFLFLVFHLVSP